MQFKILTKSPSETKKVGEILAKEILQFKRNSIICLEGDLGGGKTTCLKGFAKGLGLKTRILSPTFVIMRKFKIKNKKFNFFYHFDCYRIKKSKEILSLGFKEIVLSPKNIVAIEWSDRVKKILPKDKIILRFRFIDKLKREIMVK